MRLTLNLSEYVGEQLKDTAERLAAGNASLVADVALGYFLALPLEELSRLLSRRALERKASTRQGWTGAFWTALGREMGILDRIDNPYTSRNYGDFYAVLLLKDVGHYDEDPDPFVIHVGPQMWTADRTNEQKRFQFERSFSPVSAAEEVASWLHEIKKRK